MMEYGNEVINMIGVSSGSFVGKVCSTIRLLLEYLEGKKYKKMPKNAKVLLLHVLYTLDTLRNHLSIDFIL